MKANQFGTLSETPKAIEMVHRASDMAVDSAVETQEGHQVLAVHSACSEAGQNSSAKGSGLEEQYRLSYPGCSVWAHTCRYVPTPSPLGRAALAFKAASGPNGPALRVGEDRARPT